MDKSFKLKVKTDEKSLTQTEGKFSIQPLIFFGSYSGKTLLSFDIFIDNNSLSCSGGRILF